MNPKGLHIDIDINYNIRKFRKKFHNLCDHVRFNWSLNNCQVTFIYSKDYHSILLKEKNQKSNEIILGKWKTWLELSFLLPNIWSTSHPWWLQKHMLFRKTDQALNLIKWSKSQNNPHDIIITTSFSWTVTCIFLQLWAEQSNCQLTHIQHFFHC